MLTEDKVIEFFVMVDEFCWIFNAMLRRAFYTLLYFSDLGRFAPAINHQTIASRAQNQPDTR